jgi:hypothetical protein
LPREIQKALAHRAWHPEAFRLVVGPLEVLPLEVLPLEVLPLEAKPSVALGAAVRPGAQVLQQEHEDPWVLAPEALKVLWGR